MEKNDSEIKALEEDHENCAIKDVNLRYALDWISKNLQPLQESIKYFHEKKEDAKHINKSFKDKLLTWVFMIGTTLLINGVVYLLTKTR